jgi:tetratricopeptide (TPR) repeat protein
MSSQDAQDDREASDAQDEPVEQSHSPLRARWEWVAAKLRTTVACLRAHPRLAIAIATAVTLLVGESVTAWLVLRPATLDTASQSAEAALEAFDRGALDEAKKLAQDIYSRSDQAEPLAIASFVLGAAGGKEAEKAGPAAKGPLFLVAARSLEDALTRGLPDDRNGEAQWLLGWSLYEAGQMAASRSVLSQALEAQPQRAAEIRQLLAAAYLHDYPPKPAEALEQNRLYLAGENLTAGQRNEGLVQKAEILVVMGKSGECLDVLTRMPADANQRAAANVLRGRALLQEAQTLKAKATSPALQRQVNEKIQAALAALRDTLGIDPARTSSGRQTLYLVGVCLLESGDAPGALDQFTRLRTLDPAAPEYLAAAFEEGNLLRTMGRDAEAASAYCRALDAAGSAADFRNPWVSLEQLRHRTTEAYQRGLELHNFPPALELARRAGVVLSTDRALQMQAETCRAWGRDLVTQAEGVNSAKAQAMAREGRMQLRRSSRLWQRLAQRHVTTRFYPEDLWEGATCALEGRDYRAAIKLLEQYVKQEPRGRQPKALAALGEAFLCLDRIAEAINAFRNCIEQYPRDVAALRARLLASQAFLEKGDLATAQRLLEENLSGESLTPASREYRESLLALARLLHQAKRYDEAIGRLEEAVNRYGDSRQAIEARYLIADCHRQRALGEREKLKQDLVEQSRAARVRRMRDASTSALEWYRQTQQAMLKRQETAQLDRLETLMLRNSYFFIGSLLVDLGQFDAAVTAFTRAAARYPNAPETLEAHVQMARAYRALSKVGEARGSIEQAKLMLARMKSEIPLEQTTNYSKSQWAALLDRLSTM